MIQMCWGLNSHHLHIIGDGHQPNSRGLYTSYKDSLLKVGWPSPIRSWSTLAHMIYIITNHSLRSARWQQRSLPPRRSVLRYLKLQWRWALGVARIRGEKWKKTAKEGGVSCELLGKWKEQWVRNISQNIFFVFDVSCWLVRDQSRFRIVHTQTKVPLWPIIQVAL